MMNRAAILVVAALLVAACTAGGSDATSRPVAEPSTATATATVAATPVPSLAPAPEPRPQPSRFTIDADLDLSGQVITVLGPEINEQAEGFEAALDAFERATSARVEYTGTTDAAVVLNQALADGDPPDIAVIAQPGRLLDLAESGSVLPLPESIASMVGDGFAPFWSELVSERQLVYAVPNNASVKSLVWYSPARFDQFGYAVPQTWAQLDELTAMMRADGNRPWCIGISSGQASGWPFTDWLEDAVLRLHGPDVYDAWTANEIGFDDERIVEAAQFVSDIWFQPGNVLGGRDSIAATTFAEAGLPLLDGDCMLHRQASFYAATYLGAGATTGPRGDVDVFYLPTVSDQFGDVTLGAGDFFAALTDRPATYALLGYLAGPDYPNERIEQGPGGFLSPNLDHDVSLHGPGLDQSMARILIDADPFRFDASDLMPAAVGSDELWRASTAYVAGLIDLPTMLDRTQAAWGPRN